MNESQKYIKDKWESLVKDMTVDDKSITQAYLEQLRVDADERFASRQESIEWTNRFLKPFAWVFAIVLAVGWTHSYWSYWEARVPETECPAYHQKDLCKDMMMSKGDWSSQGNGILLFDLPDNTRCWKREGTGSAVCLLP